MTPACQVNLDGIDITANLIPAPFGKPLEGGGMALQILSGAAGYLQDSMGSGTPLISLSITDRDGGKSDAVEIVIDNRDQFPAPQQGSQFQIWLGYAETGLTYMGVFQVDSWEKKGRPRLLTVSAKAVGFDNQIKAPKSRSYHQMSVGDIVAQIAGYNGLSGMTHPDIQGIQIGHIDQSSESDLHFLTRLGDRVGGIFKLANGMLIMNDACSPMLPSGATAPLFAIDELDTTVKSWKATGNERGSYGCAIAYWQDTQQGQRAKAIANAGDGPTYRMRSLYKTQPEAQIAAQAKLSALNRGKVALNLELWGNPDIFSSARVLATSFDPDVDGLFQIRVAKHTLNGNGLATSIESESTNETGGFGAFWGGGDMGSGDAGVGGDDDDAGGDE